MTLGVGWKNERRRQHSLYPGQREALTRWHPGGSKAERGAVLRQIADAMNITQQTVASYLGGAKVALGADTFEQAQRAAEDQQLIPYYRGGGR
jgi:hypothetical protein